MKNLDLVQVDTETRKAIAQTAQAYARFSGLVTDVLEVGEDQITVSIRQVSKTTDRVYDAKELVEKAKEVFSHLPEGRYQIRVRPLTFKGEGMDAVSAEWVKNNLKKYGLSQADLVRDFGVDKHALSKLLSNQTGFTRWHKAAFYFYFKAVSADQK